MAKRKTPEGKTPAMKVDHWKVDRIKPSPVNSRYHPPAQVQHLADSMREFGWTAPLLVAADGELLAGHGRLLAALHLGLETVPVIVEGDLSESGRRAFRIADNRVAEGGSWDVEALSAEVSDLVGMEYDLTLMGFSDLQLAKMVVPEKDEWDEEDETPDIREELVSGVGDVWKMDGHRVLCGDVSDLAAHAALVGDLSPVAMVTDPSPPADPDDPEAWARLWAGFAGSVAYVWHVPKANLAVSAALETLGFRVDAQIVWPKRRVSLGRGNYQPAHECLAYAVVPRRKGRWNAKVAQSTVWRIDDKVKIPDKGDVLGATPKPAECMRRPIRHSSRPGDVIYDPAMLYGATLIAAETTGRVCVGAEAEPGLVDAIVRRWRRKTGREAIHEATGSTFAEREAPPKKRRTSRRKGPSDGEASR